MMMSIQNCTYFDKTTKQQQQHVQIEYLVNGLAIVRVDLDIVERVVQIGHVVGVVFAQLLVVGTRDHCVGQSADEARGAE